MKKAGVEKEQQDNKSIEVVAAIDFGTSHSGYAFTFRSEYCKKPAVRQIYDNRCNIPKGKSSGKQPTIVLFDTNRRFDSFGYEAEDKYNDLIENTQHREWFCFKNFKMKLHDRMKIHKDFQLEDEQGHVMDAHIVFAESIRYMKKQLEKTLKQQNPLKEDCITHWVITIPAIWTQAAKQFMREAAREAGIKDSHLQLALEPEVAALYCRSFQGGSIADSVTKAFKPSGRYMILDMGGGTVDIAIHEVAEDGSLTELTNASGGAWGGLCVDETFYEFMSNEYGKDFIDEFRKIHARDWRTLMYDFENQKRNLGYNSNRNVRVQIPGRLIAESKIPIEDLTSYDKMKIENQDFIGFFTFATKHIVQHVRELLQRVENVSLILMVGGFSQSEYVRGVMEESFSDYRIIVPLQAEVAVLHGAVLYGFEPWAISARVCQHTYGIDCRQTFIEGKHPEKYRKVVDGISKCRHIFKTIATEGDKIRLSEIRSFKFLSSHEGSHRKLDKIKLEIFVSTDKNPTYTTEDSCTNIGKIVIQPPADGWPERVNYTVDIFFGRTEFEVKVHNSADKSEMKSAFEFIEFKEDSNELMCTQENIET